MWSALRWVFSSPLIPTTEPSIQPALQPQVQVLRLLRILGRNHEENSEAMNDLLAQVGCSRAGKGSSGFAFLQILSS